MDKSLKPPYIRQLDERGDMKVWVVDGSYVRGHIDEEFTNFGQHYRFPFIPSNELWLDDASQSDEQQFFIDHLLVENRLMAKGASYEKAIVAGDQAERTERRRAGDVARLTHHGQKLPDGHDVHKRL